MRSYRIFCVIFAAFVLVYAGGRTALLRAGNQDQARASFQSIRAGARGGMAAFDARDDSYFAATMRELARGSSDLQLLAVYERGKAVYYFYAARRDLFPVPPVPTADLLDVPAYRAPPVTTIRLVSTFGYGEPEQKISVEALYTILASADLHRVGKEIVYILLIFLFVTATVLLLLTSLSGQTSEDRAGRAEYHPPAGPRAEPATAAPEASRPSAPPPRAEEPIPEAPGRGESPPAPVAAVVVEAEPSVPETPEPGAAAATPGPKSFYNDSTGLVFQDFLPSRLRSEIDRAAASDQDMVLTLISLDRSDALSRRETVYAAIAARLRESFPYRDLVFEYEDGFAVIIPDINLDKALERLEDFRSRVAGTPAEGQHVTVSVGIAARNGRLISEETLLKEASHSLAKAIRDGTNQVVAFRADPDKFRRVLAT